MCIAEVTLLQELSGYGLSGMQTSDIGSLLDGRQTTDRSRFLRVTTSLLPSFATFPSLRLPSFSSSSVFSRLQILPKVKSDLCNGTWILNRLNRVANLGNHTRTASGSLPFFSRSKIIISLSVCFRGYIHPLMRVFVSLLFTSV